ncbi:MAG: glycoside hydrolase family 1 protein, partial [Erysipelotrichaceae bacterium]
MMKDFLWGGATASYQCEGAWDIDDKVESMWDRYLHENNLESGDVASDHYHRFDEDIRMMKEGGQNAYRFSISWPRIIKNIEGDINPKGIQFYNELLDACHKYDIEPFVTLYHWDLPQYLEDIGGWQNIDTCKYFVHFADVCFKSFHTKITNWVTFNEPRWFIFNGYFIGNYPPAIHDVDATIKGCYHVMYASALAIKEFRKAHYQGKIGIVHSYTPVNGVDETIETKIAMRFADNYCNNWVLDTAALGEIPIDLLGKLQDDGHDLSYMKEEQLKVIKENTVDFLGLNYYSRTLVKPYTNGETTLIVNNKGKEGKGTSKMIIKGWFEQAYDPNSEFTQWDTEIYPKGLQEGLITAYEKYQLPIYVTENGVGMYEDVTVDEVQDDYRIEFMNDHINAIMNASDAGVDVRGYFAWSSFDLYSWKNGCEKRYGLVAIDFENELVRKPKKSYKWFKKIALSNGAEIRR